MLFFIFSPILSQCCVLILKMAAYSLLVLGLTPFFLIYSSVPSHAKGALLD